MSKRPGSKAKQYEPVSEVASTSPGELRLRPMSERDIAQVVAIERRAYSFPWAEGIFRDCMRVGYCCWVIQNSAGIEGYGIMSVGAGESHVLNLCIKKESQGRGFGRMMLGHLLRVAHDHHARSTMLEVRPSNEHALHLYKSMGFNEVGVRRGYYPGHGKREDALILAIAIDIDR